MVVPLESETEKELESLFKDECYVCERTKQELEDHSGLTRTLVRGSIENGDPEFLSFCDDDYHEDGSYTCADCGLVFKFFKPDCRSARNKLLWEIYGTKTTVNLANGSNIYCTNCVDR
jgi:hypothetical protein